MQLTIHQLTRADLPDIMELETSTFTNPWTDEFFLYEMGQYYSHTFLARDEDGSLVGFIVFWSLYDEMHVLNIAVREGLRRSGVGTRLLTDAFRFALAHGATAATLEVREKNEAGICFYERHGFEKVGLRKDYYEKPDDHAVIMWNYEIIDAL